MWIARISLQHEKDIFTEKTKRYNVNFYAYPLTHYSKGKEHLFVAMGILEGEESKKRLFIKELKKDRRIKELDIRGDIITVLINYSLKEINKAELEFFYNSSLIHVEPVLNSSDGFEYWKVGSFEKAKLKLVIEAAEKKHNGKLLSMTKTRLDNFSLISLTPKISEQQKKVILAAFKNGYYFYPRKIEIKKLADTLDISYSTCQEHLRKAEIALLP